MPRAALIPGTWFDPDLIDDDRFDYDSFTQCTWCLRGRPHTPAVHVESVEIARGEAAPQ